MHITHSNTSKKNNTNQGRIQDYSPGGSNWIFLQVFALKITEIQNLSTFKQMLAICICLTNVTVYNHKEVSTNRDTLFLCVFFKVFLVLYHFNFFFQGGQNPLDPPLGPPMQIICTWYVLQNSCISTITK